MNQNTVASITRSGTTFTAKNANDESLFTFTQQDNNTTYSAATQSAAGLMSATDKKKLDGVATGAQVNSVTGVKGNSESSYRTGNVNITAANIGAATSAHGTDQLVVERYHPSGVDISAGSVHDFDITSTKSGYTVVGVVGASTNHADCSLVAAGISVTSSKPSITVKNHASSTRNVTPYL